MGENDWNRGYNAGRRAAIAFAEADWNALRAERDALKRAAVPREPTEAMIDAAVGIDLIETGWRSGVAILWQQMYDAAIAAQAEKAMTDRIGIAVYCNTCGHRKAPIGRSVPLGLYLCDHECPGYREPPLPGSLWPGERESEFGYPCSDDATAAIAAQAKESKG